MGRTIGEIIEGRSDYYFVLASDSVRKVCEYMTDHKVGAVAVQDDDGSCCGVFSERDLLSRVVAQGVNPKSTSVSEVMKPGSDDRATGRELSGDGGADEGSRDQAPSGPGRKRLLGYGDSIGPHARLLR